jgi:ribose 5-phosphate isomerase B
MKIYIGADHAGFELKEKLKAHLHESGYSFEDKGAFNLDETDDYPDFCRPVAEAVVADPESKGIVIGGSGIGEAIVANRTHGIRASIYYGGALDIIKLSREHNDANVLSLGARMVLEEEALHAVKLFLETPFTGDERHVRRIAKIDL